MPLFNRVEPEHHSRVIYSEDEIKKRLESMKPEMQSAFIKYAEVLLQKESELFLDIIADSRGEISEVGSEIRREQELLKATAQCLSKGRTFKNDVKEDDETRVYVENEYTKKAVNQYLKAVGRELSTAKAQTLQKRRQYRLQTDPNAPAHVPSYARPVSSTSKPSSGSMSASSGSRPSTARRMRVSQPDPDFEDDTPDRQLTVAEEEKLVIEKEELMEQMKQQGARDREERERQQELIKARKEARKARAEAKKERDENQATELLEANQEAEEQQRRTKERQEQMLKERLAKKKLERRKTLQAFNTDGEPIEDENDLSVHRAKTEADLPNADNDAAENPPVAPKVAQWDVEEAQAAETKKKGKKKKKKPVLDEDGNEIVTEKKKKKKKKVNPDAADGEAGNDAEKKVRKKKKKPQVEDDLAVSEC